MQADGGGGGEEEGGGRRRQTKQTVWGAASKEQVGGGKLRWEPLGDSMGMAPKLQGHVRGAVGSVHLQFR
jgi:hypothetical protein